MSAIKKDFIDEKNYWFISAAISMTIMLVVMACAHLIGDSRYAYISSDLYEQVIDFGRLFYRKVLNGSNIDYSFEAGLGMNTSLLFAFYSFSPFNILYALFDVKYANAICIIIFLIKIGLSAAFFQLYCRYNLKASGVISIFAAICYALMSYTLYISRMNPLYDAVYMLPLIFILVKHFFDKRIIFYLSIGYAYLFVTNFYGGYIVGLVSFTYFVFYLLQNVEKKERIRYTIRYFLSVAISILLAGFILAPALYEALMQNVVENTENFTIVHIWDQIAYFFPFHSTEMYKTFPSYYCGIPILFMAPAFFFNNLVSRRHKILMIIVLGLCSISLLVKPLYLAGHMFNDPTGYTCRYVYVIAFLLISMFVKSNLCREGIDFKKVLICDCIFILVYVASYILNNLFLHSSTDIGISCSLCAIVFSVAWVILIYRFRIIDSNIKFKQFFCCVAFFLITTELGLSNYYMIKTIDFPDKSNVKPYINVTNRTISDLKEYDDGYYRVQYNSSNNANQGSLFGYMGSSLFASSGNSYIKNFLEGIGVLCNEFMITECGNTDLSRLLLNEKYIIHGQGAFDENNEIEIVINENVAGMGYVVSNDAVNYRGGGSVFENQAEVYKCLTTEHGSPIFCYEGEVSFETCNTSVELSEDGVVLKRNSVSDEGYVKISIPYIEGKKAYTWLYAGYNRASFESPIIKNNDAESVYSYVDSYLSVPHIVNMTKEEDMYCTYIYFGIDSMEEVTLYDFYFAYLDMEEVENISARLREESLEVISFEDGYVKGVIDVNEDGILFMSIPYEKGWKAYIDGQETDITPLFKDSFVGIPVTSGSHEVEMKFTAPYSKLGVIMTFVGMGLLATIVVIGRKRKVY